MALHSRPQGGRPWRRAVRGLGRPEGLWASSMTADRYHLLLCAPASTLSPTGQQRPTCHVGFLVVAAPEHSRLECQEAATETETISTGQRPMPPIRELLGPHPCSAPTAELPSIASAAPAPLAATVAGRLWHLSCHGSVGLHERAGPHSCVGRKLRSSIPAASVLSPRHDNF